MCGVGFYVDIHGRSSHKMVALAKDLLCNMTHRGASGADERDGDGAGVMTSMPHEFLASAVLDEHAIKLPSPGQYATGNVFLNPHDHLVYTECKRQFEHLALSLGLRVLLWRRLRCNSSILGPHALSKEPIIEQPFVALATSSDSESPAASVFNHAQFNRLLFILRKHAANRISLKSRFYICSLHPSHIVYKGLLNPVQVYNYFLDLNDSRYMAHFSLVHSRFSTNTLPAWDRAQPMRIIGHNGEINTLQGNKNWMRAREGLMHSEVFGRDLDSMYPIIEEFGSDSAALDNVLELLVVTGHLSLPEAIMMLIPEASPASDERSAFYTWASTLMEPWDGPALVTFADGQYVGAQLDRNGLRPCRWYLMDDDTMVCASEVGCITIDPTRIVKKGRLMPGRMLLVDTKVGRLIDDNELKRNAGRKILNALALERVVVPELVSTRHDRECWLLQVKRMNGDCEWLQSDPRLIAFGYSSEQVVMLLTPMALKGKEALGSMGNDAPLACLSNQPRLVFDYMRQLFAQVTNPPIDPIREAIVMSTKSFIGLAGNLLALDPIPNSLVALPHPILMPWDLVAIDRTHIVHTIGMRWSVEEGPNGLEPAIDQLCSEAMLAVDQGAQVLVLDDSGIGPSTAAIPCALAVGALHHCLVRTKKRGRVSILVHTGEAREVHHLAILLGYGADAIVPYLMIEAALALGGKDGPNLYVRACVDGILKVMSKMGISTLQSYRGAQIFEALGLHESVVEKCFHGTASRIQGVGFVHLAADVLCLHARAWPSRNVHRGIVLPEQGDYHSRYNGETHINDSVAIASLQDAVRSSNQGAYQRYAETTQAQIEACTLRGCLEFVTGHAGPKSIPLSEVEPWTDIVVRFCTGAMSYGSISLEAHTTLAQAMNTLGSKSNTGEGGEDVDRLYNPTVRSAIKQVASGRFGVTVGYLANADELQIKISQGAKPSEGGELPGYKVTEEIARTRKSTPGVGLISPPPHHDIYSIEDLKQLIFDLKCVNPVARVSVKLVSEVGVGVVAAGVAKAGAHHILISGHDGGTGAARWTSIKTTGLPWELGLAETHQTLVLNNLRGRVVLQTDGMIRTGRDVAIACMLGAEELGFATAPLIALGCIMMRKCHKNTCPVGIATQDPVLRAKFSGQPEHVINFFHYLAEELREIMALLGIRKVADLVGRSDLLTVNPRVLKSNAKACLLDFQSLLVPAFSLRDGVSVTMDPAEWKQPTEDDLRHKDHVLLPQAQLAIENKTPISLTLSVHNTDRTLGSLLSYHVTRLYGDAGLPPDTLHIKLLGSAGQSLGAFLARGIYIELEGDANDYVGKGLSGGKIAIYPPRARHYSFDPQANMIIGNTCLYGATSGHLFVNGLAAERFCVRNSGAVAVCEGVGDHGCEYMTGGKCIILGPTGQNFAAGMSGGLAYVLDFDASKCNTEMVDLDPLDSEDLHIVHQLISEHFNHTGSLRAQEVLSTWQAFSSRFTKIFPQDFKAVLLKSQSSELPYVVAPAANPHPLHAPNSGAGPVRKKLPPADTITDIEDSGKLVKQLLDKDRGFIKYRRTKEPLRLVKTRINDYSEVYLRMKPRDLQVQAARCMDCGIPTCQSGFGCPISNLIPSWNELVFESNWRAAFDKLMQTNNFPEFTGRVCPAPCEGACVLGINADPVNIKSIECSIIDHAFEEGWVVPNPPSTRSGYKVAIVGSGPAGLAAADTLNKAGHSVTVYERQDKAGGLLMYGIPNMKLDKQIVQRRIDLLAAEGVEYRLSTEIGVDITADQLFRQYDAILLATGATWPRDLAIPNRHLNGIHFAVDFLTQSIKHGHGTPVSVKDKHVIVIGGGDTGTDCCGTSVRQGAKSVTNFELLPPPPPSRAKENPWPEFPRVFKVDYGHEEVKVVYGKDPRTYQTLTTEFVSDGKGNVHGVNTATVEWSMEATSATQKKWKMTKIPESHKYYPADVVLIAMGFIGPELDLLKQLNVSMEGGAKVKADTTTYATNVAKVFAAGDCRRGQSLVVWGIREGREAARQMDAFLLKSSWPFLSVTGGVLTRDLGVEYKRLSVLNQVNIRPPPTMI